MVELKAWPSDARLLAITREQAQPVTSFVLESDEKFHIRWFARQRRHTNKLDKDTGNRHELVRWGVMGGRFRDSISELLKP